MRKNNVLLPLIFSGINIMTTIMMSTTTMTKNFMMITTTMTCHKNHVKSQEDDRVIKKLIGNMEVRIVCLKIRIRSVKGLSKLS